MATFAQAIPGLLNREGGLVERADDPGGLTNFGISIRAHPELSREDIINLTPAEASDLHRVESWDSIHLDLVRDEAVATSIFDFAVHSGARRAVLEAQNVVGVLDDGKLGPISLAAINGLDPRILVGHYFLARVLFWTALARRREYRPNLRGWLNRLHSLDAEIRRRRLGIFPSPD